MTKNYYFPDLFDTCYFIYLTKRIFLDKNKKMFKFSVSRGVLNFLSFFFKRILLDCKGLDGSPLRVFLRVLNWKFPTLEAHNCFLVGDIKFLIT